MTAAIVATLPGGREVRRIPLRHGALRAEVLTLGAIVQGLWIEGLDHSLVLGAPKVESYLGPARYFGAIVGRFANRIGGARFAIDGREYRTDANFLGRHSLHGGSDGADVKIWRIEALAADSVTLGLTLSDGHMGFPGRLDATARIALTADALSFDLSAQSDAPTPCSLTHHGMFDLDGTGDIRDHELMIEAGHYLPVDAELIPTGETLAVGGTDFDFRRLRRIGDAGYDHNFCLSDGPRPLRPVALLRGRNGLAMRVETTACGLQLYDGAHIDGVPGPAGRVYGAYAGLALEAQHWPDAPRRPGFPDCILRPGATFHQLTRYSFLR